MRPVSACTHVVARMSGFQYASPKARNSGLSETASSPLVQPCTQERQALHSFSGWAALCSLRLCSPSCL